MPEKIHRAGEFFTLYWFRSIEIYKFTQGKSFNSSERLYGVKT